MVCIVCVQTIHKLYTDYAWSLPQPLPKGKGFVAALMHRTWGSFYGVKESKSQRDEEPKRQREEESKRLRDKETKRGRVGERKGKKNLRKAN